MKNSLTIILFLITFITYSQDVKTITVQVSNVSNSNGVVSFTLHTKETFMKSEPVQTESSKIKDGIAKIIFNNVKPGEYAIIVLHDENENNRMDFEQNGMPKEAYGLSNNPMSFGPPQYQDAKFIVSDKDLELSIRF